MGIIVSKDNDRDSLLNERITADLREKAARTSGSVTDFAENNEYTKDLKKSGKVSWFWFGLVALAAISLVIILL